MGTIFREGMIRGYLRIIQRVPKPRKVKHRQAWFECECVCGNVVVRASDYLSRTLNISCGCKRVVQKKEPKPKKPEGIRRRMMRTFCTRRAYARKNGIAFTIEFSDLPPVPDTCPVLGIPMRFSDRANDPSSPSLDRMFPCMGYVPGNISWISNRANTLKNNASAEELRGVAAWMEKWSIAWKQKFAVLSA